MKLIISSLLFTVFILSFTGTSKNENYIFIENNNAGVKNQQDVGLKESIARGAVVYEDFCVQCHMATGKGIPGTFPPLANSDYLMNKRVESIKAVKYGLKGSIKVNGTTYTSIMAPLGLYDEEVADVMNYIYNSWGNTSKTMVTESEVSEIEE